jgi:hypothetical protein
MYLSTVGFLMKCSNTLLCNPCITKFIDVDVIDDVNKPLNDSIWQEGPFLLANNDQSLTLPHNSNQLKKLCTFLVISLALLVL